MKKIVALLLSLCLVLGVASAMAAGEKIALITMDSIDQHWITLNEGAQKAAEELGVTVTFMAPNTKDDAQQIEQVNNAVSAGCQAIVVAHQGTMEFWSQEGEGTQVTLTFPLCQEVDGHENA